VSELAHLRCRTGYTENWLYEAIGYNAEAPPERSAQKIPRAADQILKAGANL
jgi:hypothetical protein